MKKLIIILALLQCVSAQELWRRVGTQVLFANTTYTLRLTTQPVFEVSPLFLTGITFYGNLNNGTLQTADLSSATTWTLPDRSGTIDLEKKYIATVTSNFTANDTCYTLLVNASGGAVTITLPAAASNEGRVYNIKKIDATGYSVIIDGNGSETIDGNTTITFSGQYTSYTIISNGTNWFIL